MDKQNKGQSEQNLITEIKKEVQQKIKQMGYQEYRLSQQEQLKQFVQQSGWESVDGDSLMEEAEDKGEK